MRPAIKRENKKLDIAKIADCIFEVLLYSTCLFPFTMWVPVWYTGTDSQPYAFVISILAVLYYVCIKKENKCSREMMLLIFCVLLIGVYAITDAISLGIMYVAKRYVTYVSMASIPLALFFVMKARGRVWERFIKFSIWVWLIAGIIQKWFDSDFAGRYVIRQTTDIERGVVSLATEPSAYGYYCLFVLLLVWGFQKNRLFYMGLLLIQILAMAQSTVTLMYLGIYLIGYALNEILLRKKYAFLKYFGLLGGGLGALYFAYSKQLLPGRMYQIIHLVLIGDWSSLLKDGSIGKRLDGITDSIGRFVDNLALPQGFVGERYFSGNGILLVEGGFISVIILFVLANMIWKAYPGSQRFMFVFGFLIIMFSAIPYSCPIVCMYIGYCCYQAYIGVEGNEKNK